MKRLIAAAALLAVPGVALAAPAPVSGRWVTEDRSALVEIGACGAQLCGKIVRVLKATPGRAAVDANNPDVALRSRSIVGMPILSGFSAGKAEWNGRIYDPRSGKTYRSIVTREGDRLKVKGCLGPFCRTQTWTLAGTRAG